MTDDATDEQRYYLVSLASKLLQLLSAGDPLPAIIGREARLHSMSKERAEELTKAAEGAILAVEQGTVIVGPWGALYEQ